MSDKNIEVETNYIEVTKTARYVTYGKLSSETRYFWFALHGSKMRAEQLVYKFSDFDPTTHFVVAPEGLNRFYLKGFGGEVVASWMTSRDRLKEIHDFSNYLTQLYHKYTQQLSADAQKTILGFSQGGTTAFRWLHNTAIEADNLIAYSCWIPEDIDLTGSATALSQLKLIYTYGLQDAFLTEERVQLIRALMANNKLNMEELSYEGKHKVDREWLRWLFEERVMG